MMKEVVVTMHGAVLSYSKTISNRL